MSAVQQDETEAIRRHAVQVINSEAGERAELEKRYGQVWNTSELQADFDVRGFMAPFVVVRRKIDSIPKNVAAAFPAMPGFDRDWAENLTQRKE